MEQMNKNEEIEIDLREIMTALLRKKWLIMIIGIAVALAAFLASRYVLVPQYDSTTKIYVMNKQDSTSVVTYSDLQTGAQLTKDYMTLVTSRPVTDAVISELGLEMAHEDLVGIITVSNPTDTRILQITVRYSDANMAQRIADSLRKASASHITKVMDIEQVNVVEEANLPMGPSSPDVKRNTLLGGILGIFLAGFGVILLFILDDSIKMPDDVERYLGISVLSSIPVQEVELEQGKRRKRKAKKKK